MVTEVGQLSDSSAAHAGAHALTASSMSRTCPRARKPARESRSTDRPLHATLADSPTRTGPSRSPGSTRGVMVTLQTHWSR